MTPNSTEVEEPYVRPKFLSKGWFYQWVDYKAYAKALDIKNYTPEKVAIYNLSTVNTIFGGSVFFYVKSFFTSGAVASFFKGLAVKASAFVAAVVTAFSRA